MKTTIHLYSIGNMSSASTQVQSLTHQVQEVVLDTVYPVAQRCRIVVHLLMG